MGRYDYRDAGLSTCFDFKKHPYTLLDMAKDGFGLLDFLGLHQVSLVGLSTGGPIAEIMAVEQPERVSSLCLIATSLDFVSYRRALEGLPHKGPLSPPTKGYVISMRQLLSEVPASNEEHLEQRLARSDLLNGSAVPLNKEHNLALQKLFLSRLKYPPGLKNHLLANALSEEIIRTIPFQVKQPTLILHGTHDPIFPLDHPRALKEAICNTKCQIIEGMGHIPNPAFFKQWVCEIVQHVKGVSIKNP